MVVQNMIYIFYEFGSFFVVLAPFSVISKRERTYKLASKKVLTDVNLSSEGYHVTTP